MASVLPTCEEGNSYSCNQTYSSRLGSIPCMVIEHKWMHVADVGSKHLAYWSSPTASRMEVLLEQFIRTDGYPLSKLPRFDTPHFKLQII
jgi:hypothetical protein